MESEKNYRWEEVFRKKCFSIKICRRLGALRESADSIICVPKQVQKSSPICDFQGKFCDGYTIAIHSIFLSRFGIDTGRFCSISFLFSRKKSQKKQLKERTRWRHAYMHTCLFFSYILTSLVSSQVLFLPSGKETMREFLCLSQVSRKKNYLLQAYAIYGPFTFRICKKFLIWPSAC